MDKYHTSRLTYALNEKGEIVSIKDVPHGLNCNCFCPACKEPLIAKNQGTSRISHFAHKSGSECKNAYESMLHKLAKEKIRESFFHNSEFWIEYNYKSYCPNINDCKYIRYSDCYKTETKRFNLKKFYDSCEEEKLYDNDNRRADLKIFSSTNLQKESIYLEFCVTHASDKEKLHSKNKIIEIKIENDSDIFQIYHSGIKESRKISFWGFKTEDYHNNAIEQEILLTRFLLYESGKSILRRENCSCKKELVKSTPNTLLEICTHSSDTYCKYNTFKYIAYNQFQIKNCTLCINYVDCYNGTGKICRLYKLLKIPKYEDLDTSMAKSCSYFNINEDKMNSAMKIGISKDDIVFK